MLITIQPSFHCLIIEFLGKGARLGVGQSSRWTVSVLSLRVVVKHEHRQPCAVADPGIFQHLSVASRIAERGARGRRPISR